MVLIFSVLIAVTLDLTCAKPAVNYYATKYDHIDVEAIINNRRMVQYYSACLLSKGPCPPEGVELKRILPEAVLSNCGRCTEKQATVALRAIKRLKKEYPKIWSEISEKWDPDDIYVKKFESSFGKKSSQSKPVQEQVLVGNRFGSEDDEPTDNRVDGNFTSSTASTSLQTTTPITQSDSTIIKILPLSNILSSNTRTSTITDFPYEPTSPISTTSTTRAPSSASSTTRTTTTTTATRSTTTTRMPPIPGLLPLNTFFTNPPIPIRPIVNINIGANIGATVKAIKHVERVVAGIALEKLAMIKNVFLLPWRKERRKRS